MQYVHVYALVTACKERVAILISLNTAPYRGEDERSRIDGLEITSWHLQDH